MTKRRRVRLTDDDDQPPRRRIVRDDADEVPIRVDQGDTDDPPARRRIRDATSSDDDPQPPKNSGNGESDRLDGRLGFGDRGRENFLLVRDEGGYRNGAGRPRGALNFVTRQLKQGILDAAEQIGFDGRGQDGLTGYLKRLAVNEPAVFGSLLRRVLPVEVKAGVDPQSALGQVLEAARSKIAFERSRVINAKPRPTWKD